MVENKALHFSNQPLLAKEKLLVFIKSHNKSFHSYTLHFYDNFCPSMPSSALRSSSSSASWLVAIIVLHPTWTDERKLNSFFLGLGCWMWFPVVIEFFYYYHFSVHFFYIGLRVRDFLKDLWSLLSESKSKFDDVNV